VSGLDRGRFVVGQFGRGKRLQQPLLARHHQAVGRQLVGVDLIEAGAVFLDHLAGHVDRGGARHRHLDEGIFLHEPIEQRLDLRAGRV
jgi:hypothetical protein